jgi:aminomethyltransferase
LIENVLPDDPNPKPLKTVPLDAWHRAFGARMVEFAGYSMPVQYQGVLAEHLHSREHAALFDVSHMGQATLSGAAAAAALERLVPGDILGLKPGRQRYTLLTNAAGGIFDDLMVTNIAADRLFLVVNASRKEIDFTHIAANLPSGVQLDPHDDRALLALQGPAAAAVIGRIMPEAAQLPFMGAAAITLAGIPCLVTRSGYTGEDGFEISLPAEAAPEMAQRIIDEPEVAPAGLGARDSLRLEAGLCLYGNDIDELTTPIEADLAWVIGRRRRTDWDFPGAAAIRDQIEHGATRRRVGIRPDGRAPARALTEIVGVDGTAAGTVTSGGYSPTLSAPIAMGYVRKDLAAVGTALHLMVRGKPLPAHVVPLPFVPHRYAR